MHHEFLSSAVRGQAGSSKSLMEPECPESGDSRHGSFWFVVAVIDECDCIKADNVDSVWLVEGDGCVFNTASEQESLVLPSEFADVTCTSAKMLFSSIFVDESDFSSSNGVDEIIDLSTAELSVIW